MRHFISNFINYTLLSLEGIMRRAILPCVLCASILSGTDPAFPQDPPGNASPTPQVGRPPEQQQVKPPLESTAIFEQSGVLTPRNTFVIEPSLQYAHSSTYRVALVGYTVIPSINVGYIDIRNVERNTFVAALSFRYGITNYLEVETKIPYVYRTDSTSTQPTDQKNPPNVFEADGDGLGDIEFGLRYQVNRPKAGSPYYIFGLRAKSNTGKDPFEVPTDPNTTSVSGGIGLQTELPTGSGFWAVQPSLSAVYPSDPVVFFGSVSYLWNIDRSTPIGRIDPGDIIGFNFGMGLGLNEKASFSIGYDHSTVGKVKKNGEVLAGSMVSQVGSLIIGYAYKYSETTNINVSIAAGLTEAAPNVQLTLRVPMSF